MHSRPVPTASSASAPMSDTQDLMARGCSWLGRKLERQCTSGPHRGGFPDAQGWCDGREAGYVLAGLLAVRCWPAACDGRAAQLDAAAASALDFIRRRQGDHGMLDLGAAHTPNEVGFTLPDLCLAYRHLPVHAPELFDRIAPRLRDVLIAGADAVAVGNAYTANHRWAAATGPLLAVNALFPKPLYVDKAMDYLADGIDCDADGMWHEERSPNYHSVANRGMIVIADNLPRPELLDHVRRNLDLVIDFLQPNGEADTSFSHRQDRHQPDAPACSYRVARRMAIETGDGRYTTLAMRHSGGRNGPPTVLLDALERPGPLPAAQTLRESVERTLYCGPIARWRRGSVALTLAADRGGHFYSDVRDRFKGRILSEDWFHLHCGTAVIQTIRLCIAGIGGIQPTELQRLAGQKYSLTAQSSGWEHTLHFRPSRPRIMIPRDLRCSIHIDATAQRIELGLDVESTTSLAGSIEVFVRPGTHIEGIGALQPGQAANRTQDGPLIMHRGGSTIRIDGLPQASHNKSWFAPARIPDALANDGARVTVPFDLPLRAHLSLILRP